MKKRNDSSSSILDFAIVIGVIKPTVKRVSTNL